MSKQAGPAVRLCSSWRCQPWEFQFGVLLNGNSVNRVAANNLRVYYDDVACHVQGGEPLTPGVPPSCVRQDYGTLVSSWCIPLARPSTAGLFLAMEQNSTLRSRSGCTVPMCSQTGCRRLALHDRCDKRRKGPRVLGRDTDWGNAQDGISGFSAAIPHSLKAVASDC
jgi:hypothetical protein